MHDVRPRLEQSAMCYQQEPGSSTVMAHHWPGGIKNSKKSENLSEETYQAPF